MLDQLRMGRRKKSKEAAVFEAVFGLAALVLFALLISPKLSPWMQFALALLIVASVAIFVIWFAFKISEPESSVSTYEAGRIPSRSQTLLNFEAGQGMPRSATQQSASPRLGISRAL